MHEYNPLFGETALEVVEKALAGEEVESYIVVPSEAFDSAEAAQACLLYTSPSPRDKRQSRMPSSA